ncbi:hypothetical protein LTR42_006977 [Elasticomyces elasticus]|nr:hypothetical protein LTR42_006977 [Elasticomyces elasticus]
MHRRSAVMVDMGLTRNVALRLKHPTAGSRTTAIATMSDIPPLLRLPIELHMHILTYLLRQNARITMGPRELTSKKCRKGFRELMRLQDPDWKPPKNTETIAVMLACKDLAKAGIMTFWSGNTIVFGTCEKLREFMALARTEAVANITSVELGEGYHTIKVHGSPVWDAEKGDIYPRPQLLIPQIPGTVALHSAWPPSLNVLTSLPKLRRLKLHVGWLGDQECIDAQGVNDWAWQLPGHTDVRGSHVSTLYYRDQLLLSIPQQTLDDLQSLTMRYFMPVPYQYAEKPSVDVLAYAKDLQSHAWHDPPHKPDGPWERFETSAPDTMEPGEWRLFQRWLEARAAVYWDDHVENLWHAKPTYQREIEEEETGIMPAVVGLQWCSWAREWSGKNYGMRVGEVEELGRPRTLSEMAEEDVTAAEQVATKDVAYASWEWHRKRKQQKDEDDGGVVSKRARGLRSYAQLLDMRVEQMPQLELTGGNTIARPAHVSKQLT